MHDDDVGSGVERRLRDALRPSDSRLQRVIRDALAPEQRTRSQWLGPLLAAATVALVASGVVVWRTASPPPPALSIQGAGSVIVVTSEDGRRWVVDARRGTAVRGQYVIAFTK